MLRNGYACLLKKNPQQKNLLILARSISLLNVAGACVLAIHAAVRKRAGGEMYFHTLRSQPLKMARNYGLIDSQAESRHFDSKEEAVAAIFCRLDRAVCERCTARIFRECRAADRATLE